jgi:hypothetical protein|nr:MAG TPA: hypothetical protein [Bacteriophage sp.]
MISQDLSGSQPFSFWRFRNRKGIMADGDKRLEHGAKVFSFTRGEEPGNIFEDGEFWVLAIGGTPHFLNDSYCLKKETTSFPFMETDLLSGNRLILTGAAESDHIDRSDMISMNLGDVPEMHQLREPAGGNGNGIGFNFRSPDWNNAIQQTRQFKTAAS